MSIHEASAYALRTYPLGEADLIVELFTRERGRVRCVARSARRIKSRFGSCFEPLTRSRMVWWQRDKDDLGRISSCEIERSWFETLAGVEEATLAAYVAELLIGFTPENDPSPTLFRLVGAVLDALEDGIDVDLAARYTEAWVLRLSGLLPDPRRCGGCGGEITGAARVSEVTLEFFCDRGCGDRPGRRVFTAPARELLETILLQPPRQVAAGAAPAAVHGLAAILRVLVAGHLDRLPRALRALEALRRGRPAGGKIAG